MKIYSALSFLFCLLLSNAAQAQQVISYIAELPRSSTNWTQLFQLRGFDSDLGTLSQVTLSYEGNIWQSVFVENKHSAPTNYSLSNTASLSLDKLAGPNLIATGPLVLNRSGSLAAFDGMVNYGGKSGVTFTQHIMISGVYEDLNTSAYQGVPMVDFISTALGENGLLYCGNLKEGESTSAAVSLRVDYTFTAIPEPATYASILGVSAVALIALRRRRGPLGQG